VIQSGAPAIGMALRGLLTIDVASELRKLCQAQVQGAWQVPAELVRRAIRSGATKVNVSFARNQVAVADDGAGVAHGLMELTAVLIDPTADKEQRHRALTALEGAGELSLLALAGVDRLRELSIDTRDGRYRHRLGFRQGKAPSLSRTPAAGLETKISFQSGDLDRRRAARWLQDVARFAPALVTVDGAPAPEGWSETLTQAPLHPPLHGRIALLPQGDSAHAYLLAHGLIAAHVTIPDAPSFEVAVELAPQGELTPARLREAITPHVPLLIDQAVTLIVRVASQVASWPEPARARLARLALQAARRQLRAEEIERLRVFRSIGEGGPAPVDLATVRLWAESDPGRSLPALTSEQRPERYALGSEPILIADEAERSLLSDLLGVRFRTPSARESSRSLAATARRWLHRLGRTLAAAVDLVRHPARPEILPESTLLPSERGLLKALREKLRSQAGSPFVDVAMCGGGGRVRRARGRPPVLLLPRENRTVIACVRALRSDARWSRLVHLALVTSTAHPKARERAK
jgi:hypothetical protein